jgi:carboxypeptidase C (cathepsin A)
VYNMFYRVRVLLATLARATGDLAQESSAAPSHRRIQAIRHVRSILMKAESLAVAASILTLALSTGHQVYDISHGCYFFYYTIANSADVQSRWACLVI